MTNEQPDGWSEKKVLVTGSSGGIGLAVARRAVSRGARVVLHGRDEARLQEISSELGSPYVVADLSKSGEAERVASETLDTLGGELDTLPALEKSRGAIVNIASTAAQRGYANGSAYSSTKFALRSMSQCWAAELRPKNVRVITICPSEVQTGFGGADPNRPLQEQKLVADDIAYTIESTLDLAPRGFIPEVTVFATNPWT